MRPVRVGENICSAHGLVTSAIAKAVLIVLFFTHMKYSHRLTAVIFSASFLWLAIMIALTVSDYMSRNRLAIPGKQRRSVPRFR